MYPYAMNTQSGGLPTAPRRIPSMSKQSGGLPTAPRRIPPMSKQSRGLPTPPRAAAGADSNGDTATRLSRRYVNITAWAQGLEFRVQGLGFRV
jgi:hypothetical protein